VGDDPVLESAILSDSHWCLLMRVDLSTDRTILNFVNGKTHSDSS
jgi:hypothetical protein